MRSYLTVLILVFSLPGCSYPNQIVKPTNTTEVAYPASIDSPYLLPFDAAIPRELIQGNMEQRKPPWTHFGKMSFAYDFAMPIGSIIKASRKGMVMFIRDEFSDDDHENTHGNVIIVVHEDGSAALYGHIKQHGSLVTLHTIVDAGTPIAASGNSGESPVPHLHFQVNENGDFSKSKTIPVTFKDAGHEGALAKGGWYPSRRTN